MPDLDFYLISLPCSRISHHESGPCLSLSIQGLIGSVQGLVKIGQIGGASSEMKDVADSMSWANFGLFCIGMSMASERGFKHGDTFSVMR